MSEHETNFFFLLDEFPSLAEDAIKAEQAMFDYPDVSFVLARRAIEGLVGWLYKNDRRLFPPLQDDFKLNEFLNTPDFRVIVGNAIHDKLRLIQKQGNAYAHSHTNRKQKLDPISAPKIVEELMRVFAWFEQHYGKADDNRKTRSFKIERVKKTTASPQDLQKIKQQSEEKHQQLSQELQAHQKRLEEKDAQILALREKIAQTVANNNARIAKFGDPNDYNESETRALLIDVMLAEAGFVVGDRLKTEVKIENFVSDTGIGYVDYVLYGDDGVPLALVEAKRTSVSVQTGQQQAKLYADSLEKQYNRRPIIFYSNGYQTYLWDDVCYPPRLVQGFYNKQELNRLILQRNHKKPLINQEIDNNIINRYYQTRAVKSILQTFDDKHRAGLLVMATGTGKTRVAIALVDALMKANRVQKVLFLADRTSLVNQAYNNFKAQLPNVAITNLLQGKDSTGRVYLSTYHTMMGLIDDKQDDGSKRFGVGFFDLIIIDEAHRSVYQKFGEIFHYFDSLLVGLTATPRDEVDRDTYRLFGLAEGSPTDCYMLETAVADGFLVPPKAYSVPLKFLQEGIKYHELSDSEKAHWESLDWGEDGVPDEVSASAINTFLYNTDTIDKMLAHLMENGIKVDGGDKLGKTIIFASNQRHADFIAERFNQQYPAYKGEFARVITHAVKYAQTLIDDFGDKHKNPQIAISVDMLDTGIDVPEVVNLVFFKAVRSKVKFMQMIGRGTRLCQDLFAPNQDKTEFFIFDYCDNFSYFNENPDGAKTNAIESLGKRLFKAKVGVLYALQNATHANETTLIHKLTESLHGEVLLMNYENFLVRPHWQTVLHFQNQATWQKLDALLVDELHNIAGLPSDKLDNDELSAKLFDLMCYQLQLAILQQKSGHIAYYRNKISDIAGLLSLKQAIPAVACHLELIDELLGDEFWQSVGVLAIEEVRERLRGLIKLLDKTESPIVYTALDDKLGESLAVDMQFGHVGVDIDNYKKRVANFIKANENHLTIAKLRRGIALTTTDLEQLQKFVYNAQEVAGQDNFINHFGANISLPDFIRSLVGLEYQAVKQAFSDYLVGTRYNERQIRFVEMIIDELTKNGKLEASRLYEAPFNQVHYEGIDGLFSDTEADKIIHLIDDLNVTVAS